MQRSSSLPKNRSTEEIESDNQNTLNILRDLQSNVKSEMIIKNSSHAQNGEPRRESQKKDSLFKALN